MGTSRRAERSSLLTESLLNGAGNNASPQPGQWGLCKVRGRHQRARGSPPGEWPLVLCLPNP